MGREGAIAGRESGIDRSRCLDEKGRSHRELAVLQDFPLKSSRVEWSHQ